jgi:mono/diheme cytochrome c family protein
MIALRASPQHYSRRFAIGRSVAAAAVAFIPGAVSSAPAEPVSYYDSIKPVLSVHCLKCHADEEKGGLRLDSRERALQGGKSGESGVVPGDSKRSEMVRRIHSDDPDEMMPPKGPRLTDAEKGLVVRWIEEGAAWPVRDDYWAFQPPRDIPLPEGAAANPLDRFLDARLAADGVKPVPLADLRTLLRPRVFRPHRHASVP